MARKTVEIVPHPAGLSGYVAEFGAAILGAMAGLAPFHLEDHASYIANWLELLRDEPRAFLAAGAKAQAAVDWLIGTALASAHREGAGVGSGATCGGRSTPACSRTME